MPTPIIVALVDDVRIVVPNSLTLITPYVLVEQQDWFEDEIKFLRRLLQPGNKVIDIGANYGVYALSMARTVGPTGSVWAFEPASATAQLLSEGIAANGYSNVILDQSALSSTSGTAQLSLHQSSELNVLSRGAPLTAEHETVPLVTLDECMQRYGWHEIDFLKIDAEGEESNILKGGAQFFSRLSPLVQYEIRANSDLNLQLLQDFADLGYDSYRLVPGLNLLIPFDSASTMDGFLLNLFACKPDRAELLAQRGFLLNAETMHRAHEGQLPGDVAEKIRKEGKYDWRHTLAALPYGQQLAKVWEKTMAAGNSAELGEALALYAFSQDSSQSPSERFLAMEASFNLLVMLCQSEGLPSHPRLASLARVAQAYGARVIAVNALNLLGDSIAWHGGADLSEPFLTPGERFDSLPPGEAVSDWLKASVLEEYERLSAYSSYFTGSAARERLETIRDLGFGSPEMARRLHLIYARFGQPGAQSPA